MNFDLSETQQMLSQSLERLLTSHVKSKTGALGAEDDRQSALWSALAELGLPAIELDEELGGIGGSFEDLMSALPPLGASLSTEPVIPSIVVATALLQSLGSAEQQARWLQKLATGAAKACLAHGERRGRHLSSWVEACATPETDGWRLDGTKNVVVGGGEADVFLVSARTAGAAGDEGGISLFLVPRDQPGLQIRPFDLYDGSSAADVAFSSLLLPATALLGPSGGAFENIALALDRGAAATCAEAIGAMGALLDLTLDYLRTRQQFGQPIGKFQALQHRMADAYMAVELARSMALMATAAISESNNLERQKQISSAKVVVGRACREVGQSCVQVHGAIALTEEYPAGPYFKRLTMLERLFGDTDFHLARYARLAS